MTLIDQETPIDIYAGDSVIEAMCDMQPYSGGLAQHEYGLEIDCVMRIYTEPNKNIVEGVKIADRGQKPIYIVKYKEHWKDYTVALLSMIPQAVQGDNTDNENGTNELSDIYGGGFY